MCHVYYQGESLTSEMEFWLHQQPKLRPCDHLMTFPSLSVKSADCLGSSPNDRVSKSLPPPQQNYLGGGLGMKWPLENDLTSQFQWSNYGTTFWKCNILTLGAGKLRSPFGRLITVWLLKMNECPHVTRHTCGPRNGRRGQENLVWGHPDV